MVEPWPLARGPSWSACSCSPSQHPRAISPPCARRARPREALPETSFIYSADGTLITSLHAGENRVVVRSRKIPDVVRDAVIAIEDQRFYDHSGAGHARAAPSRVHRRHHRGGRRGWLDDHPAAREEALRRGRADRRAQDPRGVPRVEARTEPQQGPDPDAVPEHRVLRQRRLRDPGRVRDLLRHRAARAVPVAGGDARRSDRRAGRLRPRPSSRDGPSAAATAC